jgi:glycerate 2-kinase
MRILISPNAFKGTISAQRAGEIISDYIKTNFNAEILVSPIADGGDGTCQLLTDALKLEQIKYWSLNVYGQPILSNFGWDQVNSKAYVDVSTASGIGSLSGKSLHPRIASTFGTGILIRKAIALGAKEIVLGLGGSASVDLGIGILAALDIDFLDQKGRSLTLFSPDYLQKIHHIQRSPKTPKVKFTCLCDVKNYLLGNKGAIPVFGPQKGLANSELPEIEQTFKKLISNLYSKTKARFIDQEGFGAAGGVAAGLNAFFSTELMIGSKYFFNQIGLKEKVVWADLIITGEGRYDSQSAEGKASYELLQLSKSMGKKTILITSGNEGLKDGFDQVISLQELDFNSINLKTEAEKNLKEALQQISKLDFST